MTRNAPSLNGGRLFQPDPPLLRYFTPAPAGNRPARRVEQRDDDGGGAAETGRVTGGAICVRLCDGFYFPVPSGSIETRETVCRALCPDAETAVYRGSAVESATSDGGRTYASLKTAFLYRNERVNGCTCRADPGDRTKYLSPFSDPTLKTGDAVVTADGALVLTGKGGPPFKSRDFVSFLAASLPQQARTRIAALLGMSRDGLMARAARPILTAKGQADPSDEEDIPEITVTRRRAETSAPSPLVKDRARGDARVVLPGPWVTQ